MSIEIKGFGTLSNGIEASLYTITNKHGNSLSVSDYGATLVNLLIEDKAGEKRDIVLGYDNVSGYESGEAFFGATIGRNANRIAEAFFKINGKTYILDSNDNGNNLHSGKDYYNKRMWQIRSKNYKSVTFTLHSADGDQGYPGALDVEVTYTLTDDNEVEIKYATTPNEDTIINMTNHSYFNLNGATGGTVLEHEVVIASYFFTKADAKSIPTGELVEVINTPMDFTTRKTIGKQIDSTYKATALGKGYDHNWVLENAGKCKKVAEMSSKDSGIVMEVYTDLPGMQFYTGNFLANEMGKNGVVYEKRSGACFETQYFPDAIHHENFQSPICKGGENYRTTTVYKFVLD